MAATATECPYRTVGQFAQRFDVSIKSVERWIRAGIAPKHVRIGGRVRFHEDAITAWLIENEGK